MAKHKDIFDTLMGAYEVDQLDLNDWEGEFISSIGKRLEDDRPLTWNQFKILNKIYERIG